MKNSTTMSEKASRPVSSKQPWEEDTPKNDIEEYKQRIKEKGHPPGWEPRMQFLLTVAGDLPTYEEEEEIVRALQEIKHKEEAEKQAQP